MRRLNPRDIPPHLRRRLANGCGGAGGWRVPSWVMHAIGLTRDWCDEHDVEYAIGGSESDRLRADARLVARILFQAIKSPPWQWWRRIGGAIATWRLVRSRGEKYWNDRGPVRSVDDIYRVIEDTDDG